MEEDRNQQTESVDTEEQSIRPMTPTIENGSPTLECLREEQDEIEPVLHEDSQSKEPSEEVEGHSRNEIDVAAAMEEIHKEHGTKKKRKANRESWKKEVNKKKRESGTEYVGRKYTSKKEFVVENKPARLLGDRCTCKASFTECTALSEEDRQNIFGDVWKMDWAQKKTFCICYNPEKRGL